MDRRFHTRERMDFFGVRPSKGLGQNFLNDFSVVQEIVYSAGLTKEDFVIEVGPGLGAMTGRLAESAGQVLAVEIDRSLIPPLQAVCMEHGNIELIEGDILKLDIRSIAAERIAASGGALKRVKVVANLPYYITTPIILSFLEHALPLLTSMTFMVQKEVAQRMTARPGGKEYGALTVAVGYFSEPELLFTVPPHCFLPQPAVDSAVVRLMVRKEPPFPLEDRDFFFKVVRASFCQRRKMLANSLANAPYLGISREKAAACIEALGREPGIRGEVLSPEEFGRLSNLISQNRGI